MVESTKRDEQLQRLHGLRQAVPHFSKSALHHILTDVAENGLPDLMHPKAMREGADLELNKHTAYGPLFLTRSLTIRWDTVRVCHRELFDTTLFSL